jgi:hypothetical protein
VTGVSGVFGLERFELPGEESSLTFPALEFKLLAVCGLCPVSGLLFDDPVIEGAFVIGDLLSSLFFSTASAIFTDGGRSRRIRADAAAPAAPSFSMARIGAQPSKGRSGAFGIVLKSVDPRQKHAPDGDSGINKALQVKGPRLLCVTKPQFSVTAIDLKGERWDWESICY